MTAVKISQAKRSTCSDTPVSDISENPLVLTVKNGNHIGAKHAIDIGEIHVIGSSQDCEMILMDEGVAPHHCFISRFENKVMIRAIDKAVMLCEQMLMPGETRQVKINEAIVLDSATILLQEVTDKQSSSLFSSSVKWKFMLAAFVPMLVAGVAAGFGHNDFSRSLFPGKLDVLEHEQMFNAERDTIDDVKKAPDGNNQPDNMAGINDEQTASDEPLQPQPIAEAIDPIKERISDDVSEILRLSGFVAETRYLGDGQVEITGFFGDGKAVETIIRSRAIRDIKGLTRIIERNMDDIEVEPAIISKKHISRFVGGADPYLVISDGSRYYLGAELPGGGQLVAIDDSDIVIKTSQGQQRFSGPDALSW